MSWSRRSALPACLLFALLSLALLSLVLALPGVAVADSTAPVPYPGSGQQDTGKVKTAPKDTAKDKSQGGGSSGDEPGSVQTKQTSGATDLPPAATTSPNMGGGTVSGTGGGTLQPQPQPRTAALVVEREETCVYPTYTDHMVSTDSVTLTLPGTDGPVSGSGSYTLSGTGYTLSGPSAYKGQVKDDSELVLDYGQWWYNGKAMTPAAPEMPTAGSVVSLPLELDAAKTITFQNAHADTAPCSGTVTYRLKLERETQVWDVRLYGYSENTFHELYGGIESDGKSGTLQYNHGVTFTFDLTARITLTKRKGAWEYTSGVIQAAKADYKYHQQPGLYAVEKSSCTGCASVAQLKGMPISGALSGKQLTLKWPRLQPVVNLNTRFKLACADGPAKASCENAKKNGSTFSVQEEDFLARASGYIVVLTPGSQTPAVIKNTLKGATSLRIQHQFVLTQIK